MSSMKKAVQWAVNIANNNKYLYGAGASHTTPFEKYKGRYFDCSSLVAFALYHGGYYNGNQYAFSTGNEESALRQLGFNIVPYSQVGANNLKSGMILWYTAQESGQSYGHTCMMVSPTKLVEAATNTLPKAQQIRVKDFDERGWMHVAYNNDIDFDVGLWDAKSICALLGNMWYESTINPMIATDTSAYGVGLIQWSNAGSYNANWNSVLTKANAYGNPTHNPKQISAQLSAIEYELLDGTITASGGYSPTQQYNLTGEEFITNSKNKSIEYLTKCYSINRGEFGPRHNNWQGVRKAQELYKKLPSYNKSISDIGHLDYVITDEILGDCYGKENSGFPSVDCAWYNAKLIYDTLLSGSDRPSPFDSKRKRQGMIFLPRKKWY